MKRYGLFHNLRNDLAIRMTGSAVVACGLLAGFSSMSGCKEPIEPRKSTPTATPVVTLPPGSLGQTDARCSQADFVCSVASDLVTLCKEKEPTNTSCSDAVWTKVQWDRIVGIQKSGDATLASCPSETWFVNTKTDPLLVRDKGSITGTILSDVDRGESVKCIGLSTSKEDGEWMKAKTNSGQEGFMKKEYLATTAPSGSAGGTSKPAATKAIAGARGICVKTEYLQKIPQGKPKNGGACSTLDGQPHLGFWQNAHPNETLVGCYEERSGWGFVPGTQGAFRWDCLCQVKKVIRTQVPPNTACPPGSKAE
jgi:hypothetical protein